MLERSGSFIGLSDPFAPLVEFPFTVSATKRATLMQLTGEDLRHIICNFGGKEKEEVVKNLVREFSSVKASLSLERDERNSVVMSKQPVITPDEGEAGKRQSSSACRQLDSKSRGSVMMSSFVRDSLQLKQESVDETMLRQKLDALMDAIAGTERKLDRCCSLLREVESDFTMVHSVQQLLERLATAMAGPDGRPVHLDFDDGSGQDGDEAQGRRPSARPDSAGLIGRSFNLLAGMLSDPRRGGGAKPSACSMSSDGQGTEESEA